MIKDSLGLQDEASDLLALLFGLQRVGREELLKGQRQETSCEKFIDSLCEELKDRTC
jgi:hypothetical protein